MQEFVRRCWARPLSERPSAASAPRSQVIRLVYGYHSNGIGPSLSGYQTTVIIVSNGEGTVVSSSPVIRLVYWVVYG